MTGRVLIAGGGITGLAAAYRLQQVARAAGVPAEIVVVEREPRLGGKTQTERVDGMVIEAGPDSFLAGKPWLSQLCGELGLPVTGTNPAIQTTYIYHRGRLEALPLGLRLMIPTRLGPFVRTRLLSPAGKLRAALEPLVPVRRGDADESIGSFVCRRFGREVLERIAGPLMGGIYGGDWNVISLKATFPMFLRMEQEQGSLLLAARKMKPAGLNGPTGFSAFLTVPTGLRTVVEALVKATDGVRYLTATALVALRQATGGAGWVAELSNGERMEADAVVVALPAYEAASLVRDFLQEVAGELSAIPHGSSVVVALAYRRQDVGRPLDASGFLVPKAEPLELAACTWVSSKWTQAAPPDRALLRAFLGRAGGRDWTQETDEAILAEARRGLEVTMGLRADPILTRIFRWPRAMPQYTVGHLDRMGRVDRLLERAPGLYLAGAAFRGVGLPDCVREGFTAAERAARHLGWPS